MCKDEKKIQTGVRLTSPFSSLLLFHCNHVFFICPLPILNDSIYPTVQHVSDCPTCVKLTEARRRCIAACIIASIILASYTVSVERYKSSVTVGILVDEKNLERDFSMRAIFFTSCKPFFFLPRSLTLYKMECKMF